MLLGQPGQFGDGLTAAPHLAQRLQLSLIADIHHRFDAHECAQECTGTGQPAAPIQMVQVIHGEEMADGDVYKRQDMV